MKHTCDTHFQSMIDNICISFEDLFCPLYHPSSDVSTDLKIGFANQMAGGQVCTIYIKLCNYHHHIICVQYLLENIPQSGDSIY